jgi:hypothetical protein
VCSAGGTEAEQKDLGELFVTPRDIDAAGAELSRAIGYGLSMATQEGLSLQEVQELLN